MALLFNIHSVSVINSYSVGYLYTKKFICQKSNLVLFVPNYLGSILLLVTLYHSLVTGTDQKNPLAMGLLLPKKKGCEKKRKKKNIKREI